MHTADPIRSFYERYPHPVPLDEIPSGIFSGAEWLEGCPSQFFHVYWPHRERRLDLSILIAGCGTRQAALYGAALPKSRIVALDVSGESLARSESLCGKYAIANVEHRCLPIEDVAQLGMNFDLIISTGVLHHLPDPHAGLTALRGVLRREGSMSLMLYARYGRAGVYQIQEILQRLGITFDIATAQDFDNIRRMVEALPAAHPMKSLLKILPHEISSNEGLTDLLLNPRDRAYSIPEVYETLERCGIAVQEWFDRMQYEPALLGMRPGALAEIADQLPTRERYAVGELYSSRIIKHRFVGCRDDRPPTTYGLGPGSPNFDGLIPIKNRGIKLDKTDQQAGRTEWMVLDHYKQNGFRINFSALEAKVFNLIDGRRSIAEIHRQAALPSAGSVAAFWKRAYQADLVWFKS